MDLDIFGCCIKKSQRQKFKLPPSKRSAHEDLKVIPDTVESKYDWYETIGTGSYGTVRRVIRKSDNAEMSCKIIDTATFCESMIDLTLQEVELLINLSGKHPNLLELYQCTKRRSQLHLFMELCKGETLQEGLATRVKNEDDICDIATQMFDALNFLHSKKITHMDLKFANIMFVDKGGLEIRLLDFGLSAKRRTGVMVKGRRGTLNYMAPEVISGLVFTEMADIWSAGVILYRLLTGTKPWLMRRKSTNPAILKMRFNLDKLQWPDSVSQTARKVVLAALAFEPDKRLTAEEILMMPWFQRNEEGTTVLIGEDTQIRLQLFANRGKLQKALHTLMMKRVEMPNADLIDFATKTFNEVGKKNEFQPEEFASFLLDYKLSGSEGSEMIMGGISEEDLEQIFEAIDTDHSGSINLAEFLEWFKYDYIMKQDQRLWKFIQTLDGDHDGYISLKDVEVAIKEDHEDDWEIYMIVFRDAFSDEGDMSIEEFGHLLRQDVEDTYTKMQPGSMESEFLYKNKRDPVHNRQEKLQSFQELLGSIGKE